MRSLPRRCFKIAVAAVARKCVLVLVCFRQSLSRMLSVVDYIGRIWWIAHFTYTVTRLSRLWILYCSVQKNHLGTQKCQHLNIHKVWLKSQKSNNPVDPISRWHTWQHTWQREEVCPKLTTVQHMRRQRQQ